MTGLERLRKVADELEVDAGCDELHRIHGDEGDLCDGRLCFECQRKALRIIADQIEREQRAGDTTVSSYDLLPDCDREAISLALDCGGVDEMKKRLMPEGVEWDGSVLRIRTAENVDYDGEPVRFGDVVSDGYETGRVYYVTFDTVNPVIIGFTDETPDQDPGTWLEVSVNDGERVKRPERKDSRPDGCCHPGSYECDELAFRNQNSGEDVYADKCLVPELRRLRESGIRTLGSCCGHGTTRPNIIVAPECEGAMRRQGYEGRRNKFGVLEFAAKSSCPAPKVLDADGVEIRVGDRLYDTDTGCGRTVRAVNDNGTVEFEGYENRGWFVRFLTHRAPVLAADGRPLREGETVWGIGREQHEYTVLGQPGLGGGTGRFKVACHDVTDDVDCYCDPSQLTHEQPDSWELLEADCSMNTGVYTRERMGIDVDKVPAKESRRIDMMRDLVRRAKKLAGDA